MLPITIDFIIVYYKINGATKSTKGELSNIMSIAEILHYSIIRFNGYQLVRRVVITR